MYFIRIFGTQVIRYFRINNIFENFKLRVLNLVEHFIELGYNFKFKYAGGISLPLNVIMLTLV